MIFKHCPATICASDLPCILFALAASRAFPHYFSDMHCGCQKNNWAKLDRHWKTMGNWASFICFTAPHHSAFSHQNRGTHTRCCAHLLSRTQTCNFLFTSLCTLVLCISLLPFLFTHSWLHRRDIPDTERHQRRMLILQPSWFWTCKQTNKKGVWKF